MALDRHSSQPLYAQLKNLILDRIDAQTYRPGQRIPSETVLCDELSLSRPTVRQAMAELVQEGVLVIVKGKGTFVAQEPERLAIDQVSGQLFSLLAARSLDPFRKLTVDRLAAEAALDQAFSRKHDTHAGYWSVAWQEERDGAPYVLCRSLIPVDFFPDLGPDLTQQKRLIDILANKYAYLPQKNTGRIFVRQPQLLEARALRLPRTTPVLVLTGTLTARSGPICELSTAVMRADAVMLNLGSGRS